MVTLYLFANCPHDNEATQCTLFHISGSTRVTKLFPSKEWRLLVISFIIFFGKLKKVLLCHYCAMIMSYLLFELKISYCGERDVYERKPRSCLGRVFNFKLGSLTDNTINPLNANDHF
jgi:hypothetical protein